MISYAEYVQAIKGIEEEMQQIETAMEYRAIELGCTTDFTKRLTEKQEELLNADLFMQSLKYRRSALASQREFIKRTGEYPPNWEASGEENFDGVPPDSEPDDSQLEVGFDPYLGCYTDDC